MRAVWRHATRLHHRAGFPVAILLMIPALVWVWQAAAEPFVSVFSGALPRDVLSGGLFSEFDRNHAGFVLDQPSIGKYLFWFSVMAASTLPYALAVRWLSDRRSRAGHLGYAIPAAVLCVFLLCILTWPLFWLVQYVHSMGFTARRVYGLLYGLGGVLLVVGFLVLAIRRPRERMASHEVASARA